MVSIPLTLTDLAPDLIREITGWIKTTRDMDAYLTTRRAHKETRAVWHLLRRKNNERWDLHMHARSMALSIEDRLVVSIKSFVRLCRPSLFIATSYCDDAYVIRHGLWDPSETNVNVRDSTGETPLLVACRKGSVRCVWALLELGANVNYANADGRTSMMLCCQNGHDLCARALIKAGADIEKPDKNGWTPLMKACWNGHDLCAPGTDRGESGPPETKHFWRERLDDRPSVR